MGLFSEEDALALPEGVAGTVSAGVEGPCEAGPEAPPRGRSAGEIPEAPPLPVRYWTTPTRGSVARVDARSYASRAFPARLTGGAFFRASAPTSI